MESIAHSTHYYAKPSTIFKDECETAYYMNWLGADHSTTSYILFDMQVTHMITTVTLKQTTQVAEFNRGTTNFDILVGNSTATLTLATQGVMTNVENPRVQCKDIPLQSYHVGYIARYLQFTATGYYWHGPGLKYIHFE